MKTGIISWKISFLATVAAVLALAPLNLVRADSWWGYGYKAPNWILKHGGSIIRYKIKNISGSPSEYKAVMYDDDGDYVEREFSLEELFDDAKDGKYKIKAYRGGTEDRTTYKGGKSFAEITVTAHPGETIEIEFDYKKKKAKLVKSYFKFGGEPEEDEEDEENEERPKIAKPLPNPVVRDIPAPTPAVPTEPEPIEALSLKTVTPRPEPVPFQIQTENIAKEPSFLELAEDFVHPDVMAQEIHPVPLYSEPEETKEIFLDKIWQSIARWFSSL